MKKSKLKRILFNYAVWLLIVTSIAFVICIKICSFKDFIETFPAIAIISLTIGTMSIANEKL